MIDKEGIVFTLLRDAPLCGYLVISYFQLRNWKSILTKQMNQAKQKWVFKNQSCVSFSPVGWNVFKVKTGCMQQVQTIYNVHVNNRCRSRKFVELLLFCHYYQSGKCIVEDVIGTIFEKPLFQIRSQSISWLIF